MVTLKLRTTGDFTPITIDDKEYRLKSQLDLSLSVQHELMRLKRADISTERSQEEEEWRLLGEGVCGPRQCDGRRN